MREVISRGIPKIHDTSRPRPRFAKIDNFTIEAIRRKIYTMYAENQVPTIKSLYNKLMADDVEFPYKEKTLERLLKTIGFKYQTLDQRQAIMETDRLIKIRTAYIQAIKKYRLEGRNIVYLDETWYDSHDVIKKGFVDQSSKCCLNAPCSRGHRIIILHAGSTNGWIPGTLLLSAKNIKRSNADYHQDMTADLFEKWFKDCLIPNLPPHTVIIMDNASYHSRQINKVPTMGSRKDAIINYLVSNYVPIHAKYSKKILMKIVNEIKGEKTYATDTFAKEHGHEVLRLPPYYCILNPIELIWAELKKKVRRANTSPNLNAAVVDLVRTSASEIGEDSWKNCMEHVIQIENKFVPLCTVNPLVINLENESETENSE